MTKERNKLEGDWEVSAEVDYLDITYVIRHAAMTSQVLSVFGG